jgi:hypothetical protein
LDTPRLADKIVEADETRPTNSIGAHRVDYREEVELNNDKASMKDLVRVIESEDSSLGDD